MAVAVVGLFLSLSANAQGGGGIDWSPVQFGGDPYVYQYITVDPGQYILEPGIPQCGDQRDTRMGDEANALASSFLYATGAGSFLAKQGGSLFGNFVTQYQTEVGNATSGTIAQVLSDLGVVSRYAACGTVVLVVPEHYHVVQIMAGAKDAAGAWTMPVSSTACDQPEIPYVKCRVPDAAWMNVQYGQIVMGTFVNWSRQVRDAYLSVWFEPNR
jgi:hypothetical protein